MSAVRSKTVQSVDRAVALLRAIADTDADQSLADLALRCGLERPTAWRLLWTLESNGLVDKVEPSHYRLATGWQGLSRRHAEDSLARLAHPVLEQLALEHHVTASLVLVRRFGLEYVDQVDSPLFSSPRWDGALSLHASSPGKAVLATLPDAEWRAMVGITLESLTDTTITDLEELAAELVTVRHQGYATCQGEDVTYSNGASAAIVVGRPSARRDRPVGSRPPGPELPPGRARHRRGCRCRPGDRPPAAGVMAGRLMTASAAPLWARPNLPMSGPRLPDLDRRAREDHDTLDTPAWNRPGVPSEPVSESVDGSGVRAGRAVW